MNGKLQLALRWVRYATARSYYHLPQGRGRCFVPSALAGYCNDLTGKTEWPGRLDRGGIPLHVDARGTPFYFPITIAQKGLGHWDRWLLSARCDAAQLAAALQVGRWLVDDLDGHGGWACWNRMRAATVSPYSGMAQGQGISLLLRLHEATGELDWRLAADRAWRFLVYDRSARSVGRELHGFPLLEEYPKAAVNGVLNGWIFAAFGLHDYALATGRADARQAARDAFCAIDCSIELYDTGAWSAYDLNGRIASPFYHDLHVAQLAVLGEAYPEARTVRLVGKRFASYRGSTLRVIRAVSRKVCQKLRERDYEVLA
jgi:heparosan-N-sulfate-glucuronate 5-epimerase